jgi:4-hydroxy-tetrahydrodipicolinate synthase
MAGHRVTILQGLGALYGLFELESGAGGFMAGFAFPEVLNAMVEAVRRRQTERARELCNRYLELIVFEQQPGVALRKEIYRMRGLIHINRVRHPVEP